MTPGDLPLLLAIDDDPDQLALVRIAALHAGGLRIMGAESAAEALIQLQARKEIGLPPPDLILTDLKMPDMNGLELMQRIRRNETLRGVPIVFLTTSTYTGDRAVAERAGAAGFFPKPIRFADLVALLKALSAYVPRPSAAPREASRVPARP